MTYRGHIKNGQITLDEAVALPEGAEIKLEVIESSQSILNKIAELAVPSGLPRDYSQQHEHYVKGTPRK